MSTGRYNIRYLISAFVLAITAGCVTSPTSHNTLKTPQNQYQAYIVDPQSDTLSALTVEQLAQHLANADVVIVGEYHGHHASHLLQAQLQLALFQRQPQQILSMEQFETHQQDALNQYLAGRSGESAMIEDTGAWDNYRASYRPLVEFALSHQLPVIAANAPGDIVRCVGREGPNIVDDLSQAQRQTIARQPFMDTPAYRQRFDDAIGASHGGDAMPELSDHRIKGDFLYFLQPLPAAYKSDDRRNRAMRERFSQAGQQPCD